MPEVTYIGLPRILALAKAAAAAGMMESAHKLEAKIKQAAPIEEVSYAAVYTLILRLLAVIA